MTDRWGPLIDAETLTGLIGAPDVRIVDATWYLPIADGDAQADYEAAHIPGAVRLDISNLCDPDHPSPHMLPKPDAFAEAVGRQGIGSAHRIVVYDRGEYAATRIWWLFRTFGHEAVAVLDGGLPAWLAAGGATEAGVPSPAPATFTARLDPSLVRTMEQMKQNLKTGAEAVVDARPPARFAGELPEMRPGLHSGHIPGSKNLHYVRLHDPETGRFLPPDQIALHFREAGIDPAGPVVATCGSGVSACSLALGLALTGRWDVPVYDGSWAEWGAYDDTPKVLGRD